MMIIDPRNGDAEDDQSSPKARSLARLAGGFLAEISPLKLGLAFLMLVVLPNLAVGSAPLVLTAWIRSISAGLHAAAGIGSAAVIGLLLALALFAWRPLFTMLEANFWSLNSLIVQPVYMLAREALRHLRASGPSRAWATALGAGAIVAAVGLAIVLAAWPYTRWWGGIAELARPSRLVLPALANALVVMAAYAAAAAMAWAFADAFMDPVVDLDPFDAPDPAKRIHRVVHLSDLHAVGEPFGFRIECGRGGPQGNSRLGQLLAKLQAIHDAEPLDLILITGDMTDAGRAAEWALFLETLEGHPSLMAVTLMLPGNHDVSIIDRANPARLELPWAAAKQWRRLRQLSAMEHVHGHRSTVFAGVPPVPERRLSDALQPHRARLRAFADRGGWRGAAFVNRLWRESFPLVVPPTEPNGLGVLLLDTNAETHFSFSNALGFLALRQAAAIEAAIRAHPRACWIVAMHHHLVEYPGNTSALAIRLGTALINGSWVVRQLKHYGNRIVVMHGHRHVDWIGRCGPVRIVSAPSPVMGAIDDAPSYCLLHRLQPSDGRLGLLQPERIDLPSLGGRTGTAMA